MKDQASALRDRVARERGYRDLRPLRVSRIAGQMDELAATGDDFYTEQTMGNQYAERDHEAQGRHYMRHLDAMTREGLHEKSAIAAELAHRDIESQRLRTLLAGSYSGPSALYTDDGCLQDSTEHPHINFRDDTVDEIERKMTERGLRWVQRAAATATTNERPSGEG